MVRRCRFCRFRSGQQLMRMQRKWDGVTVVLTLTPTPTPQIYPQPHPQPEPQTPNPTPPPLQVLSGTAVLENALTLGGGAFLGALQWFHERRHADGEVRK